MSPYDIQLILHAYGSKAPFPLAGTEHYQDRVIQLIADEILEPGSVHLCLTKRGVAYVNMLLATPFPVRGFIDPRTNEPVLVKVP